MDSCPAVRGYCDLRRLHRRVRPHPRLGVELASLSLGKSAVARAVPPDGLLPRATRTGSDAGLSARSGDPDPLEHAKPFYRAGERLPRAAGPELLLAERARARTRLRGSRGPGLCARFLLGLPGRALRGGSVSGQGPESWPCRVAVSFWFAGGCRLWRGFALHGALERQASQGTCGFRSAPLGSEDRVLGARRRTHGALGSAALHVHSGAAAGGPDLCPFEEL